ncbi:hypothetical protein [Cytobacillus solani]|nr:hypothetical protein [Cytobacillus solani]
MNIKKKIIASIGVVLVSLVLFVSVGGGVNVADLPRGGFIFTK